MAPTDTGTSLKFPAGKVKTHRPGGANPYDIPWTNASRWEPWFSWAAAESGVDASLIVAMAIVESDANQYWTHALTGTRDEVIAVNDAFGGGPSVGIMQIKPLFWQKIMPEADVYTPQGNIRLGARLMANFTSETGSWENAIRQKSVVGASQGTYHCMGTGANDMSLTRTVGSMPRVFLDVTSDHWRLRYMPHDWYPFLL